MSEKISLCGNDCLKCPRYLAETEDELNAVAELWYRVGWRDSILTAEEMRCGGCSSHKSCTYRLVDCAAEHGVERCRLCPEFPCDRIDDMLRRSDAGRARCLEVCTPDEFRRLEESSFRKWEKSEQGIVFAALKRRLGSAPSRLFVRTFYAQKNQQNR